jgi:trehalose 6-phosphate phosphatase
MKMSLPLFESGARRLGDIVKPGLLCAFDFDGTLAPIVTQPDKASLPLGILQRLIELSALAPVAVITGRSLDDIRARLGFEPDFTVGNHGLEGIPGWEPRAQAFERLCGDWQRQLATALGDRDAFDPNIWVEDKRYSLSVHYRLARDHTHVSAQLAALFGSLTPLPRVIAGKCVFNLLPQDGADKGTALNELMTISGARSVIYVGDDVTDEEVFRLDRQDLLSVRIERATDTAAPFFLHHRLDLFHLLDELIKRLHEQRATNWIATDRIAARHAGGT